MGWGSRGMALFPDRPWACFSNRGSGGWQAKIFFFPAAKGEESFGTRLGKSSRSPAARGIPAATSPGIFHPASSMSSTSIRPSTAATASRQILRAAAVFLPLRRAATVLDLAKIAGGEEEGFAANHRNADPPHRARRGEASQARPLGRMLYARGKRGMMTCRFPVPRKIVV